MVTRIHQDNNSDLVIFFDYQVESSEFNTFKDRITKQILKNVEVKGFRRGQAPVNVAMKQIDPIQLQTTVIQETLQKYAQDAIEDASNELEKAKRVKQFTEISLSPEHTKETDEGFQFRVIITVFPDIDLDPIKKINIKDSELELPAGRPEFDAFLTVEKQRLLTENNEFVDESKAASEGNKVIINTVGTVAGENDPRLTIKELELVLGSGQFLPDFEKGLKGVKTGETKTFPVQFPDDYFEPSLKGVVAEFTAEVVAVKKPKYTDIQSIFEQNDQLKQQFGNETKFDEFLTQFYNDETSRLQDEARQRIIIKKTVDVIKDFALPEDRVEGEASRIFQAVQKDATENNVSVHTIFQKTGIPGSDDSKIKDDLQVKAAIQDYVRREFKLSVILNFIYETCVDPKITQEQLEKAAKEIAKDPQRYGLGINATQEDIQNATMDRLKRQYGAQYLFNTLTKGDKDSKQDSVKELKKHSKKETKTKDK